MLRIGYFYVFRWDDPCAPVGIQPLPADMLRTIVWWQGVAIWERQGMFGVLTTDRLSLALAEWEDYRQQQVYAVDYHKSRPPRVSWQQVVPIAAEIVASLLQNRQEPLKQHPTGDPSPHDEAPKGQA
jgi:hypothetical protein